MIDILIVEDSATEALLLKTLLSEEKDMRVVGVATNGKQAVELTAKLKPNLITMDIQMPQLNGLEATKQIMTQNPTPIVVISSKLDSEMDLTFQALEAGALSVLSKPSNVHKPTFAAERKHILSTLRNMSQIKVIKRRFNLNKPKLPAFLTRTKPVDKNVELIVIGASVGGPQVLNKIFSSLPADFPVPIVVVQHMTPGFVEGFTNWLDENTALTVKTAEQNEKLTAGMIYFAPDSQHVEIIKNNEVLTAQLVKSPPVSGFCPSITVMMQSVARACAGNAVGMILTGMGSDGAQGLLDMKQAGGLTVIQDAKSAVVFGMAGVAESLGAVDKVLEPDKMAEYLTDLFKK